MNYLSMQQAADFLGVSIQRVHALAKGGRIGTQVAGHWLFTRQELEQYDRDRQGRKQGGRRRKS